MAVWAPHTASPKGEEKNLKRQYLWDMPGGNLPDFSVTFTYGADTHFSWNALNQSIYDLWLTSWGFDSSPVALCLARAVNLAHDGRLDLATSETSPSQLANRTRYVLRFKPPTTQGQFVASDPDLSSPAFFILAGLTDESVQPSTITSPMATASTTKSAATLSASLREMATTSVPDPGPARTGTMSPGAAAALTMGLIMFVCFLVVLEVTFLWRKARRRREGRGGGQRATQMRFPRLGLGNRGQFVQVGKTELPTKSPWMPPELPGDSEWGRQAHELQGGGPGMGVRSWDEQASWCTIALNSSLVELEAASDDSPTGHAPVRLLPEDR
ncbi:hypothetical protein MFIFM68171_08481 [Madurella fahalii]|uniref:Uncharacterized protein n=1 Tax=Madurella fahalii TaxID=1157608 RepID=A0ABQ0GKJ3_9PEZI